MNITFITGNLGKVKYAELWLGHSLKHHKLDLDEIQSLVLQEVVEHKVRQAFGMLGKTVLVEDTSLEFEAMNGSPGPLIKWFDASNIICRMLDGFDTRSATARTCYGLFDGHDIRFFEDVMRGSIAVKPRGKGWGWDDVFINDGYDITRAEMDEQTYEKTSYRKTALNKLDKYLQSQG